MPYSAAYPFESVHTSPKRLMMQEARDEVLAVYRSEGLDKLPSWKESEDHIALELEFMAVLGDRIVAAAEASDEAEVEASAFHPSATSWRIIWQAGHRS